MSPLVPLTMFGWIPFVLVLFTMLPSRRAVVVAFVSAWMFLPIYRYDIGGFLPNYNKMSATCLGTLIATFIFDAGRFTTLRLRWYDLPVIAWCTVPIASSITVGLGARDGLSGIMNTTIIWGVPYLIGRVYFNSLAGLKELAMGLVVGGIAYLPFCLFEIRFSPQLHTMVYGFHQHSFAQARRGDGFRPTVFMQHGLAVATFMCTATLLATWFAVEEKGKRVLGLPMWMWAFVLGVTSVLCKSNGATVLMLVGVLALVSTRVLRMSVAVWALALVPAVYIFARTVGGWDARVILDFAAIFSDRAVGSLATRLRAEDVIWREVQRFPLFGAARFIWSEGFQDGEDTRRVVADALWVYALGRSGVVGLGAFVGIITIPVLLFLTRFPARTWIYPAAGMAGAWAVCLTLYMIDCLSNAMINPLFLLATGGIAATAAWRGGRPPEEGPKRRGQPAAPMRPRSMLVPARRPVPVEARP